MRKCEYVLKAVRPDMSSIFDPGFKYPMKGPVEAWDWDESVSCGRGLHGYLGGCGDSNYVTLGRLDWDQYKWLVIKTERKGLIDLGDKCKFRKGDVVYVGDVRGAARRLNSLGYTRGVMGSVVRCWDRLYADVHVGSFSEVFCGSEAKVTVGDYSQVSTGYSSLVTAGERSTVKVGACSRVFLTGNGCEVDSGSDTAIYLTGSLSLTIIGWGSIMTPGKVFTIPHYGRFHFNGLTLEEK